MTVTTGMQMLLALLSLLAGPPAMTFIAKRLLDHLGILLPTWVYMVAAIFGLPTYAAVYLTLRERRQRREAASMGARFAPRIKGKWPGNLDVMARIVRKFMNGYPGLCLPGREHLALNLGRIQVKNRWN
ncbi:hypothetical protein MPER_05885 [Moniliophthora perniciosa FA553]|nr:hypothetical protein MPER_05885 [Moniliophthora perniciosa FA553]